MAGFFTKQETASISRPDGKIYSCISCGLYRNCNSPKMIPQGQGKIMIVGASPGELDDKRGLMFQGSINKLVDKAFQQFGINIFEDCILTNSIRCKLTTKEGNRTPSNYEIECCRKFLLKSIQELKPKVIFLLGDEAIYSLIGHRWKKDLDKVAKWRGWTIPDQDFKCWIVPIYDPKKVQACKGEEMWNIWLSDIENGLSKLNEKIPIYQEPNIEYLTEDLLPVLSTIKNGSIAFDYETTGLKPHAEGHRIICASVAYSENNVYTFMMPKSRSGRKPFTDLVQNPNVKKVAQNMKFEDTWTNVRLGVPVVNWDFDTMLATHIIDNRSSVTGLKFQTYAQFGVIDYDSHISPYLKAVNEDSKNNLNRIMELVKKPGGQRELLKYCAYDSINEYRLSVMWKKILKF